jgi:hypothetical protein
MFHAHAGKRKGPQQKIAVSRPPGPARHASTEAQPGARRPHALPRRAAEAPKTLRTVLSQDNNQPGHLEGQLQQGGDEDSHLAFGCARACLQE